jgi:hypothetical protein
MNDGVQSANALEFGAVPDVVQVNKQTFAEHGNAGAPSMFDAFVHALQLNKIAYEVRTDIFKNEYIETKATVQVREIRTLRRILASSNTSILATVWSKLDCYLRVRV